jgi:hypothetical protein
MQPFIKKYFDLVCQNVSKAQFDKTVQNGIHLAVPRFDAGSGGVSSELL